MKVAVINCGSSSIKYDVFDVKGCTMVATGLVEKIGTQNSVLRQRKLKTDGTFDEQTHATPLPDHARGFEFMVAANRKDRIIKDDSQLLGIGHRVVHGGEVFREPAVIDDEVVEAIRGLAHLAPLHNPSNLLGIEAARARFPGVPQVAVFDTAFHQTLQPYAFHYAAPYDWYTKYGIRRYGFHGTSHSYVSRMAARHLGKAAEEVNLITLHLGNGASCTAVQGGVSRDTSMGMTPLEGLIMGTRSGDIDPALPFHLMRHTGMAAEEIEKCLNARSGLLGVCGVNDMREVERQARLGIERAILALDMFCYRVKKYIGAYCAVLGRVDAVVFTAGIGENSALVRGKVCGGLEHMGIRVDEAKNGAASGDISEIQTDGAPVRILVVKTEEEREIARETIETISKGASARPAPQTTSGAPQPPYSHHSREGK